jgi:hypothetical protein
VEVRVMGIQQTYGDGAFENLYDPFENVGKPKSFNKTVVRPMTGPEKEPENFERSSEVTVEPKLVEEKKGRGRPRSDKPKPWEALGLSQAAYYRKKAKGEV